MPVVSETILGVSTTTCLSPNPGQIRERMLIKFAIPAPGAVRRSGPGIDPSADTGEGAPCTLSGYVADPGQRVRPAGFRPEIIYVRTRMAPVPSARPARAGRYLKNGLFYLSARPRRNAPAPTGSIHQTWERMNEAYSQALYSAAPSVEESTPPWSPSWPCLWICCRYFNQRFNPAVCGKPDTNARRRLAIAHDDEKEPFRLMGRFGETIDH